MAAVIVSGTGSGDHARRLSDTGLFREANDQEMQALPPLVPTLLARCSDQTHRISQAVQQAIRKHAPHLQRSKTADTCARPALHRSSLPRFLASVSSFPLVGYSQTSPFNIEVIPSVVTPILETAPDVLQEPRQLKDVAPLLPPILPLLKREDVQQLHPEILYSPLQQLTQWKTEVMSVPIARYVEEEILIAEDPSDVDGNSPAKICGAEATLFRLAQAHPVGNYTYVGFVYLVKLEESRYTLFGSNIPSAEAVSLPSHPSSPAAALHYSVEKELFGPSIFREAHLEWLTHVLQGKHPNFKIM